MSYFADHLAWQQRVTQEFKAQSSHLDTQMYQANGQWFNYPDLLNYLKQTNGKKGMGQANMSRGFGAHGAQDIVQGQPGSVPAMYGLTSPKSRQPSETGSNYGYVPKSKLLYSRQQNKRSKSGYGGSRPGMREAVGPYTGEEETKSQLSKNNMKRFNETIQEGGPQSTKSQVRSIYSKPRSQVRSRLGSGVGSRAGRSILSGGQKQQKKMDIYQAVEKLDDLQIDQISAIISTNKPNQEPNQEEVNAELADAVVELPEANVAGNEEDRMTSVSQVKPTQSQISGMSGRTYISSLQNQLNEEKEARQALENELQELKKISSEIGSQLASIQQEKKKE